MASPSPRSHAKRLEEDNYNLRLQVSKLQLALRKCTKKDRLEGDARATQLHAPNQQMDLVLAELGALREHVTRLQDENKSLQSQLSRIQGSRGASAFTLGSLPEDPWVTTIPTSLAPEPLKHDRQQQTAFAPSAGQKFSEGDIAFIEREIMSLKQQLTATRQKLQVAQPESPEVALAGGGPRRVVQGSERQGSGKNTGAVKANKKTASGLGRCLKEATARTVNNRGKAAGPVNGRSHARLLRSPTK